MTAIRHGSPIHMRYVLAGFWAGQLFGRVALAHATTHFGVRFAITAYCVLVIGLLAIAQFITNMPSNAVAVAFVGFFLG